MSNDDLRRALPPSTRRPPPEDEAPTVVALPSFTTAGPPSAVAAPSSPDHDPGDELPIASCPPPPPARSKRFATSHSDRPRETPPPPPPTALARPARRLNQPAGHAPTAEPSNARDVSLGAAPNQVALADRPAAWVSEHKTRRPIPRGLRIAMTALVLVLLAVVAASRCGAPHQAATATYDLAVENVVNSEDLHTRRELTADDFRADEPRVQIREPSPAVHDPSTEPTSEAPLSLEERRARREHDPDDLIQHRGTARRSSSPDHEPATPRQQSSTEQDLIFFVTPPSTQGTGGANDPASPRRLVPAATRLSGRLVGNLELRGGSVSALVRLDRDTNLPAGTTCIGQARADRDGRVDIRFHTAVLPDGQKLRIQAEAQGRDGTTGVFGQVARAADPTQAGSVAGDVAESTSERVVASALGSGIVGSAASDAINSRNRRSRGPTWSEGDADVVTVPQGSIVWILFLDEVTADDR